MSEPEKQLREILYILSIKERQIKTTLIVSLWSEWLKPKPKSDISYCKNVEQRENSSIAGGSANLCSLYGNQYGGSLGRREMMYLKNQLYHSWAYT